MYFVTRKQWGARAPEEDYTAITDPKGVKIHYLGGFFSGVEHAACDDKMRSIQDYQMDHSDEDYFDFAYNLAVCQHGYVYNGRGAGNRSGANGDQNLNAAHYAVVAFVANRGVTQPSQSMTTGIQDAIAYLRRKGAGKEIKGHRDGFATACPGDPLYKLVGDRTLDPGRLYDGGRHTVKTDETLGEISRRYNVPRRYIIAVNDLEEPYDLVVGQKLDIPARGVPLGETPDDGGGDGGGEKPPTGRLTPFPGVDWFYAKPSSPIVTAMGERLVAEGCDAYASGPGPDWSDADRASYQQWQRKLGYTGDDADGWPGRTSWEQLRVPWTGELPAPDPVLYEPFPGASWFRSEPTDWIILEMGNRLVAEGCGEYGDGGPGPEWIDADRASYRQWQRKLGYTGDDADGWPGAASWDALRVPRVTPIPTEAFPGEKWFRSEPDSPIVTAMGKRLVAQGCGEYSQGPGPRWTDVDRASYRNWQRQCGYTGDQLDGWPEQETWEELVVPKIED